MKRIIFLIAFLGMMSWAFGKPAKRPETPNYKKGIEYLEQKDYSNAYESFYKDVKENPKSGYSHYWMGYILARYNEYGRALNMMGEALKFIPSADVPFIESIYNTRSYIYLEMEDTVKALADLNMGIKKCPSSTVLYEKRADIYFYQSNYSQSDADYKKILSLKPGSVIAYMGLGRNLLEKEKYDEAIKQFDYAASLDNSYPEAYAFKAAAYKKQKKYDEATENIISALLLNSEQRKAVNLMLTMPDDAYQMMASKLKVQMMKNPEDAHWPFYIGEIYEVNNEFKTALPYYDKAISKEFSAVIARRFYYCYKKLGHVENAMKYIDLALKLDTTNVEDLGSKAGLYADMYKMDKAMEVIDQLVKKAPDNSYSYRKRAEFKIKMKQYEDAIEDLSMAITLSPSAIHAYSSRGRCYEKLGKKELAKKDFNKLLELDPDGNTSSHAYVLLFLGKNEEAKAAFKKMIEDPELNQASSYYNNACYYSLIGEKQEAINCLKKALEKGFRSFHHMETDWDLDNIRDMQEYKSLVSEYKKILEQEIKELDKMKSPINIDEQLKAKEEELNSKK